MTALLLDDERLALDALRVKLRRVAPDLRILAECQEPARTETLIRQLQPDVVFLDVEMPGLDGFSLLSRFPDPPFEVIFTTAYSEYAVSALRVSALDFLLKPISETELRAALDRLAQKRQAPKAAPLHAQFNKIAVPSLKGLSFVPVQDIVWLQAESNYTTFHLLNRQKLVASRTLRDFAEILEPLQFVRVHRSSLINLAHLVEYVRGEGGTVRLADGSEVEVARGEKKAFLERIGLGG